ncbi:MAG: DEAD/DEAH box helicase [Plectolyngbya sp. WJT66-NPBG17]|jgi:SNF2 family DNA or RNA helicase|nr:DEAD/DEAH box helicase [Plectolyngbya sp. WJT66-NPBG17]MBW4528150.1 DEAD/DEAH box helicase [Phormidium tanganyikae FI6-MK23]
MHILHGAWIPDDSTDFVQGGNFYLWVETIEKLKPLKSQPWLHPHHLAEKPLATFLSQEFGLSITSHSISPVFFLLPSTEKPCPSPELARYLEVDQPETWDWQYWIVHGYCCPLSQVIKLLNELHFLALHNLVEVQIGADLLFWYHYTQFFKHTILNDRYIPALKYRSLSVPKRKSKATPTFEVYPGWEILSTDYESELGHCVERMPLLCAVGFQARPAQNQMRDRMTLLRHFSEVLLHEIITRTPIPATFEKQIANTLINDCFKSSIAPANYSLEQYQHWQNWRNRIAQSQTEYLFHLCFALQSPQDAKDPWILEFQAASRQDPSVRVPLEDYWNARTAKRKTLLKQFGQDFEQQLLMQLGYAARIYPKLWAGLETDQPIQILLSVEDATTFLQETAWVLEDAGYKVIVPAWWTPQGWRRAKVRMQAKGRKLGGSGKSKSYFSAETLIDYQYELSINGETVSPKEWEQLVQSKADLVQFRGQWIQLDRSKMQQMLEFWKKHRSENPELSLMDLIKLSAEGSNGIELEVVQDSTLSMMLNQLNDKSQLEVLPDPKQLNGTLRAYQKRGVSWLHYLESLGLNGCLADDMGMGKSFQVIARFVQEREALPKTRKKTAQIPPTLLIAPTSVLGNWQKEIEKFAPQLRSHLHHGSDRAQTFEAFQKAIADCDVVITSYTLIRKDITFLTAVTWQRIVIDEAQNIKNPSAAQTKAVLKLPAQHRLALTGTPVENRLLDLWSIFNFLNPGYLGKEAQFRKSFEIPIQKNNDRTKSATLKQLVEPFILRRVKTDPAIIQDLPDKVEQKLYCNLTKEQASLYEAVVKDILKQLNEVEGIQRKGMMLATLLKLKQICNHPMQFLQDDSEFSPERSHKLQRLSEMIQEAIEEGESILVFTQFTEIGAALEKYLKHQHYRTYYLHGGTARSKREKMIAEFQDPDTEPSIFILSIKAGGVGITLTKANHVFHFDRWWNPAVEDQATDRAFRIGQKKNVFVHKFVALGTLEERIDQMIEDKKKLASAIVGSDESWLTELNNEAFKQLITLNRSTILD